MFAWQKNMVKRVQGLESLVKSMNSSIEQSAATGRDLAQMEDNLRQTKIELESVKGSLDRANVVGPVFASAAGIGSLYLATLIFRNIRHG